MYHMCQRIYTFSLVSKSFHIWRITSNTVHNILTFSAILFSVNLQQANKSLVLLPPIRQNISSLLKVGQVTFQCLFFFPSSLPIRVSLSLLNISTKIRDMNNVFGMLLTKLLIYGIFPNYYRNTFRIHTAFHFGELQMRSNRAAAIQTRILQAS